jgi:ribosome maturation factor RimP
MNTLEKNIYKIAAETAEKNGLFLIELNIRGDLKRRVIEIFIDGEKNITADDCASISRQIDQQLETLQDMRSIYRLDVSSPGVDRPIKYLKQFPKHLNRKFEVTYSSESGTKTTTGALTAIEGEELSFLANKQLTVINFNNIIKAKVIISFS